MRRKVCVDSFLGLLVDIMIQNSPLLDTGKMNYFGFRVVAFKTPTLALWLPVRGE